MAANLWLPVESAALGIAVGDGDLLLDGVGLVVGVATSRSGVARLLRWVGDGRAALFLLANDDAAEQCRGLIEPARHVMAARALGRRVVLVCTPEVDIAFFAAAALVFEGLSPPAAIEVVQHVLPESFRTIEEEIGPSAFRGYLDEWLERQAPAPAPGAV